MLTEPNENSIFKLTSSFMFNVKAKSLVAKRRLPDFEKKQAQKKRLESCFPLSSTISFWKNQLV